MDTFWHLKHSFHYYSVTFVNHKISLASVTWSVTWNARLVRAASPRARAAAMTHGATLHPLEKMVVSFGEGPEVVRQQVVRRRHSQQREARGLAQQAAPARPLAAARRRHGRHPRAAAHAAQLIAQLVRCKQTNR